MVTGKCFSLGSEAGGNLAGNPVLVRSALEAHSPLQREADPEVHCALGRQLDIIW